MRRPTIPTYRRAILFDTREGQAWRLEETGTRSGLVLVIPDGPAGEARRWVSPEQCRELAAVTFLLTTEPPREAP